MNSMKKGVIAATVIVIGAIIGIVCIQSKKETLLGEEEALNIGKELYDKATGIFDSWKDSNVYCAKTGNVGYDKKYDLLIKDKIEYSKTEFSNINELKEYLYEWLSYDIINKYITDNDVKDYSDLTDDDTYIDYIEKDNTLYCLDELRNVGGFYTYKSYDIKVDNITSDKIDYTIISHYCTDNCLVEEFENTNEDKETKFTIIYENNHWIVSDYTYHDI